MIEVSCTTTSVLFYYENLWDLIYLKLAKQLAKLDTAKCWATSCNWATPVFDACIVQIPGLHVDVELSISDLIMQRKLILKNSHKPFVRLLLLLMLWYLLQCTELQRSPIVPPSIDASEAQRGTPQTLICPSWSVVQTAAEGPRFTATLLRMVL